MKKLDIVILTCILAIALGLRLYKINTPLADAHSWRQADTAAVARNFVRNGFDLMKPTYDDLTSIETGIENPKGYRMVEFPIYNAIFAAMYRYLPIVSLEVYGRLTSALFSLVTIAVLYYLALKEHSRAAAIGTAITFATMPYFVFFSRVILPETTAVACMMLSILFLYFVTQFKNSTAKSLTYFFLSVLFYAMALLIKPTVVFYSISIAYLFISTYKFQLLKEWKAYVFVILGVIPFVLWRMYISNYPEGIPDSSWLFTNVNTFEGSKNIFFKPAFFRWVFYERLGKMMLGIYLSFLMLLGITGKFKKYFLHSIFASAIVYLFTFQGGNVQHTYYQTVIFPGIALMVGLGIGQLVSATNQAFSKTLAYPTLVLVFVFSFAFSYYEIKDFYNTPPDLPPIAKLIGAFTKPTDLIVTDRLGDTTLLYLADRKGSPAVYRSIEELKNMGYSYLVTANKETTEKLKTEGKEILVESNQFAIIKL
ncbi:hypothetical protein BH09PAT2_BH09PAT2_07980 [soil metagenome]